MPIYLQLDPHGVITGTASTPQEDAGWIICAHEPLPNNWTDMAYDPDPEDGGFAPRPHLSEPDNTPSGIAWSDLPEGTWVYVSEAVEVVLLGKMQVKADGVASFDLPEAGSYLFDLSPPSPYLPMLWRIDVP